MIQLTKEEREKFATYLEQEAAVEEGLIQQMELMKLPTVNHYKARASARRVVAADLRAIYEF